MAPRRPDPAVIDETAISLAVDRMSVEVVRALADAGIEAILLKGPAILDRLYDRGEHRPYVDCDLLIPAAAEPAVAAVLRRREPGSAFPTPAWRTSTNGTVAEITWTCTAASPAWRRPRSASGRS